MTRFPEPVFVGGEARDAIAAVLTLAFAADPVNRWMLPAPADHLGFFGLVVDVMGKDAFAGRTALMLDDGSAAALWLRPGATIDWSGFAPMEEIPRTPERKSEGDAFWEQVGSFHPDAPHWYLPLTGVDPARQNRGLGAILMKTMCARFDAEGALAYLESSNPRNIGFYERHGFEALGRVQVSSSPVMTPMLRRPRR